MQGREGKWGEKRVNGVCKRKEFVNGNGSPIYMIGGREKCVCVYR